MHNTRWAAASGLFTPTGPLQAGFHSAVGGCQLSCRVGRSSTRRMRGAPSRGRGGRAGLPSVHLKCSRKARPHIESSRCHTGRECTSIACIAQLPFDRGAAGSRNLVVLFYRYPDLALHAENFVLTQYKVNVPVSGTSCSAPTFGGFVALLNDVRLQAGKSPLGCRFVCLRSAGTRRCSPPLRAVPFPLSAAAAAILCWRRWLNPLLYAHPEAFVDIVTGSNPGCAVDSSVGYLGTGFQAAKGWDPLTGLGTPNMTRWREIVRNLP